MRFGTNRGWFLVGAGYRSVARYASPEAAIFVKTCVLTKIRRFHPALSLAIRAGIFKYVRCGLMGIMAVSHKKTSRILKESWILKLNMTMWKYASPVVRMFLSIHAKFVDNALYKARRALGE